jgi:hypothetical protein
MSRAALHVAAALCAFAALLGNVNAAALRKSKLNESGQLVLQKAVRGQPAEWDAKNYGEGPDPGDPTAGTAASIEGGAGDEVDISDDTYYGEGPDPGDPTAGTAASIEGGAGFDISDDDTTLVRTTARNPGRDLTVMTWNILADALSNDGFVLAQTDASGQLDKAATSALISHQVRFKEGTVSRCLETITQHCYSDVKPHPTCAANAFLGWVGKMVKPVLASFRENPGNEKRDEICPAQAAESWTTFFDDHNGWGDVILCGNQECFDNAPKGTTVLKQNDAFTSFASLQKDFTSAAETYCNDLWEIIRTEALDKHQEADSRDLVWQGPEGRKNRIASIVGKEHPDIVMMQELDHYNGMKAALKEHGYTSTVNRDDAESDDAESHGSWDNMDGLQCKKGKGLEKLWEGYVSYLGNGNDRKEAFAPKTCSSARKIGKKGDDGVAVFWREDRLSASQIRYRYYDPSYYAEGDLAGSPMALDKARPLKGGSSGIVGVLLQDRDGRKAWAFSTHWDSGDDVKKEHSRVKQAETAAAFISACLMEEPGATFVLGMDGNTYQGFKVGEFSQTPNAYATLVSMIEGGASNFDPNLALFPWGHGNENVETTNPQDSKQRADATLYASVNKIRGVLSEQPHKIGEYQLNRIDFVVSGGALKARSVRGLIETNLNRDKIDAAYGNILPSKECPSDHHWVMVGYTWARDSGAPLVDPGAPLEHPSARPNNPGEAAQELRGTTAEDSDSGMQIGDTYYTDVNR